MKAVRPYLYLVLLLGLLSSTVQGRVLEANPASTAELARHQISTAAGFGFETKDLAVGYGEPDYGFGAGALGAVQSTRDGCIETSLFYTVAKQIDSHVSLGIRLRYFTKRLEGAGSTFEGLYLTSDYGVTVYPHPKLSLFAVGQDVLYYTLYESPRDLVMNIQSGIGLYLTDTVCVSFRMNDLLNRQPHIEKWMISTSLTRKNMQVDYSLAGFFDKPQSLKHRIGLTWNF